MARNVTTFADLAKRFATAPAKLEATVRRQLRAVGMRVRDTATEKFGIYQPSVGPYPAWDRLSPVTVRLKARAGGAEDPLIGHYPTGHRNTVWPAPLRTTIQSYVEDTGAFTDMAVHVGTADPLGLYHEYGTEDVPARPFLRPAAHQNEQFFLRRMAMAWQETAMLI